MHGGDIKNQACSHQPQNKDLQSKWREIRGIWPVHNQICKQHVLFIIPSQSHDGISSWQMHPFPPLAFLHQQLLYSPSTSSDTNKDSGMYSGSIHTLGVFQWSFLAALAHISLCRFCNDGFLRLFLEVNPSKWPHRWSHGVQWWTSPTLGVPGDEEPTWKTGKSLQKWK